MVACFQGEDLLPHWTSMCSPAVFGEPHKKIRLESAVLLRGVSDSFSILGVLFLSLSFFFFTSPYVTSDLTLISLFSCLLFPFMKSCSKQYPGNLYCVFVSPSPG